MKLSKRKKGWLIAISIILCIVLLLTLAGPYLVLLAARQPKVAASYNYSEYFHDT